jgi:hypothetical protein
MSRATSPVVSWSSRLPLRAAHSASNRAYVRSHAASCAAPTGNGGSAAKNAFSAAALGKQRTAVLWPNPRGSKVVMLYRSCKEAGSPS